MLKSTFGEIAMKSRQRQKDILFSLIVFFSAFAVNLLIQKLFTTQTLVPMIFVFGVFLISLKTHGYCYGITSAIVSVFAVDFAFTYPYYVFGFFVEESILSAVIMMVVADSTSTLNIRIRDQEKLRSENEKERMRGNLLRAISHDLRTPLTSIAGLTDVLSDNDEKMTSAERKEIYKEITDDATWLIRMVENLLSVTKIRIDSENLRKVPELAEEIVASAVQKLKKYYPDVRITVSAPEEVLFVPMDCVLIEQVLINLMENSIRHSGGATEIKVQVSTDGEFAKFTDSENGKGFDRAILKKIRTEDFVMPSMREGDNSKNMGIGLSVCTTIIKAHGGKIVAENENGAKICFYLPVEKEGKYE